MGVLAGIAGWIFIISLLAGAGIIGLELLWYRLPGGDKKKRYAKRIALVTGASSGLGRMYACLVAERFKDIDEIWLVARRKDKLKETAELIDMKTRYIICDLSKADETDLLRAVLEEENVRVGVLFNCAGFGKIGDHESLSIEQQTGMTEVNCIAAVKVTDMCIPRMEKGDHIVNVCSVAAFQPLQKLGIYAATKSFLLKYTRSLRIELMPRKIQVTAVCPYWIRDTEFIDVAADDKKENAHTKSDMTKISITNEKTRDKGIKHFVLASDVSTVGRVSYFWAMVGMPVVTPGIISTIHRFFSKLLPDTVLQYVWGVIRRL